LCAPRFCATLLLVEILAQYINTSPNATHLYDWDNINIEELDANVLHKMVVQEKLRVDRKYEPTFEAGKLYKWTVPTASGDRVTLDLCERVYEDGVVFRMVWNGETFTPSAKSFTIPHCLMSLYIQNYTLFVDFKRQLKELL